MAKSKSRKKRLSTTKKRRLSSSMKLANCRYSDMLPGILQLNSINWDISVPPEVAGISEDILSTPWCSGQINLLLPVTKFSTSSSMIVYYQENIKQRKIYFQDVLDKIWDFYNNTSVIPADLTYIAMEKSMTDVADKILEKYAENPEIMDSLRFVHFVDGSKKFGGLKHQNDNYYTLQLVDK